MQVAAKESKGAAAIVDAIRQASVDGMPLSIQGGRSKSFLGRDVQGEPLDTAGCSGVVNYEPSELVITARAGTPLAELETVLAERSQIFAFEPPAYGEAATLGGTIACGLSGPRRAYAGAARDFVLGTKCVNGKGDVLRFGGEVMKNVAGYDVSRLMVGAFGTLGVLVEVSLKVLPRPISEQTVYLELNAAQALQRMHEWAAQPLPISATCYDGTRLSIRLSGSDNALQTARRTLGGEVDPNGASLWTAIKEHRASFFATGKPLWRISVAPATPQLDLSGDWLLEWGGALRWLQSDADPAHIRLMVQRAGGHATLFRDGDRHGDIFHPLSPQLFKLHQNLKRAFDPDGILNPGRMYRGL